MSRHGLSEILMAAVFLAALPAAAQTDDAARQDASVQALGSFSKTTTHHGVAHSTTDSGGILVSYRYFFSKHHGVEGDYAYTLDTQRYELSAGGFGVRTNAHEISGAYVFRMPLGKVTPFALSGVSALVLDPKDFRGASTQARAAFLYGAGADINLANGLFVRAQYRGQVYNSPTFDLPGLSGHDRVSHQAEPSLGIGFRF